MQLACQKIFAGKISADYPKPGGRISGMPGIIYEIRFCFPTDKQRRCMYRFSGIPGFFTRYNPGKGTTAAGNLKKRDDSSFFQNLYAFVTGWFWKNRS